MKTTTNKIVQTSDFVRSLNLSNYTFGGQHHAQEALDEILNSYYPDNEQSIFRIKSEESIVCEINRTGCGEKNKTFENKQFLPFEVKDTPEFQTLEHILIESFGNENPRGYMCNLGKYGGCHKMNTCSKSSHINELKDVLIVQLLIFTYDSDPLSVSYGHRRKIFPNLIVDPQIDQYSLQGIIWHHGSNVDSGHYTSMIKHNTNWYHISDDNLNSYEPKFQCTSNEQSVPYLLFYTKNNTRLLTNEPLNIEMDEEAEPIDFSIHEMSNAETKKRTFDPSKDDLDEDNSAKKSKLDAHEEEIIIVNEETPLNDLHEKKLMKMKMLII